MGDCNLFIFSQFLLSIWKINKLGIFVEDCKYISNLKTKFRERTGEQAFNMTLTQSE